MVTPAISWAQTQAPRTRFTLTIEAVDYELIDGTIVFMIFFFSDPEHPHPALRTLEGETIEITVINRDTRPHGFAVTGVPAALIPSIAPNETRVSRFTAPVGGSYLYHDPINSPVNRLLGLYGGFIVAPRLGTTPNGSPTPFSRDRQTAEVRAFFDALGRTARFVGNQWDPADPEREKVWIFSQVDPLLHARVDRGEAVNGATLGDTYVPRYFQINAISGFDTGLHSGLPAEKAEAAGEIEPEGRQGQPTVLRTINAGFLTHSPHIHGNSIFQLTKQSGDTVTCTDNVLELDTWTLPPMARTDVLLPFERPPDIPLAAWPPKQEPFPLRYVMHCHTEMSQTAGGGNYPQGLVTHWEITAPL